MRVVPDNNSAFALGRRKTHPLGLMVIGYPSRIDVHTASASSGVITGRSVCPKTVWTSNNDLKNDRRY